MRSKREEIMESNGVHNLTKVILKATEGKDPVDAYYDVKIALDVLRIEMDIALGN